MGTNGLDPVDQLRDRDKCKASPTKKQYHDSKEAWKAAGIRSQETKLDIIAYACPDCGFFHLSKKANGSDIAITTPTGALTTPALKAKTVIADFTPPERVDVPITTPIVPQGHEARRKVLREYLKERDTVTGPEIRELLGGIVTSTLSKDMAAVGWVVRSHGRGAYWTRNDHDMKPIVSIAPKPATVEASIARHPAGKAKLQPMPGAPVLAPQRLSIPISNHAGEMRTVEMIVPGPMTEAEWVQFHMILKAMSPALVSA